MGRRLLLLLAPRTKAAAPKAVASSLPAQDCPKTGAPASWYHQLFLRLETGCNEVFLHQTPNTKHGSPVRLGAHHLIHPRTSRKASRGPGCGPVRVLHALTWTGRISGRHSPQVTSCHPPVGPGLHLGPLFAVGAHDRPSGHGHGIAICRLQLQDVPLTRSARPSVVIPPTVVCSARGVCVARATLLLDALQEIGLTASAQPGRTPRLQGDRSRRFEMGVTRVLTDAVQGSPD